MRAVSIVDFFKFSCPSVCRAHVLGTTASCAIDTLPSLIPHARFHRVFGAHAKPLLWRPISAVAPHHYLITPPLTHPILHPTTPPSSSSSFTRCYVYCSYSGLQMKHFKSAFPPRFSFSLCLFEPPACVPPSPPPPPPSSKWRLHVLIIVNQTRRKFNE